MAKEADVVSYINTQLKAGQFSSARFQKGKFSAIAELLRLESGRMPCVVSSSGVVTKLSIDDIYPFQLYHRTLGSNFELVEPDFGDWFTRKEATQMRCVVMADRKRLDITKEQLKTGLALGFPLELPNTNKTALNLLSCNMVPGSFNMDTEAVYNDEFELEQFELKPTNVMVALDYEIITEVSEGCVEICS